MPFESPLPDAAARAAALNARYRHHAGIAVLRRALSDPTVGRIALVSSFGAESVVLLHMLARLDNTVPVIFVDTQMLFPETLEYQRDLARRLDLRDLRIIRADPDTVATQDPYGALHLRDPDACCALRKTAPLAEALDGFDAWITGRKRFQAGTREALEHFEADGPTRIKVNPLAHWSPENIRDYRINNRLPAHPLVARGYPSIGCKPCTSPVAPGEDPRAGRWRGQDKVECGIHITNGRITRQGA